MDFICFVCGKGIKGVGSVDRMGRHYHNKCFGKPIAEVSSDCKGCDEKALEIVRLQETITGLRGVLKLVAKSTVGLLGSTHELIEGLGNPDADTQDEIKGVVGV